MLLRLLPILLALGAALASYRLSVWRTARVLDENSSELADPILARLTERMARVLEVRRIRVMIYEIDAVNGLAAADGRIFITRGFYQRYRAGEVTAEEMASVIAHELGHVALGHARRRMIDFTGQNAIRMLLIVTLARFIPVVGVLVANVLTRILASRLSRKDEYEADAYATALLIRSGIGAAGQKSLFAKLSALTGNRAGSMPAWLLTHPGTADRIKAIEANEAAWTR